MKLSGREVPHQGFTLVVSPLNAEPWLRRNDGREVSVTIAARNAAGEAAVVSNHVGRLGLPRVPADGPTQADAMRDLADVDERCLLFTVDGQVIVIGESSCVGAGYAGDCWHFRMDGGLEVQVLLRPAGPRLAEVA